MGPRPAIRSLLFGAGLFLSGLAVGVAIAERASAPSQVDIREGATLVSFLPESVMSLTYSTPEGMTTAQRSAPSAPFQILSTYAGGGPVHRCSTSADMGGRLNNLATLTARRSLTLEQREGEFPVQLGVIEVRDSVIGEPSGPVQVFTNRNRTAVAVILDRRAAEVTLHAAEIEWLKTACSGLSQGPQPDSRG